MTLGFNLLGAFLPPDCHVPLDGLKLWHL